MKLLLIGILILGSVSTFASPLTRPCFSSCSEVFKSAKFTRSCYVLTDMGDLYFKDVIKGKLSSSRDMKIEAQDYRVGEKIMECEASLNDY